MNDDVIIFHQFPWAIDCLHPNSLSHYSYLLSHSVEVFKVSLEEGQVLTVCDIRLLYIEGMVVI